MYVTIISTAIVNSRSIEDDIDNDGQKKLGTSALFVKFKTKK